MELIGGKNKMELEKHEDELFLLFKCAKEEDKPKIIEQIFKEWLRKNNFKVSSMTDDKRIIIIGENNNDV